MFLLIHLEYLLFIQVSVGTTENTIINFLVMLVTSLVASAYILLQVFLSVLCTKQSKKMASARRSRQTLVRSCQFDNNMCMGKKE